VIIIVSMMTTQTTNPTVLRIFSQATFLCMTAGIVSVGDSPRKGRQLDKAAYENARALYRAAQPFLKLETK